MTTRERRSFFLVFPAFFLPMILFGTCSSTDPRQEALDTARALWVSNQMLHYRFRYSEFGHTSTGGGGISAIVEVREGVVISTTDVFPVDTRSPLNFDTIEMVFDRIQFRIDRGSDFSVQYNPELGYPEQMDFPVVEGNVTIKVSNVERLE